MQKAFKAARKEEVSLILDGDKLAVRSGEAGKTALRTETVEDYPSHRLGPVLATATISLPHLAGVARSIADDDSRPTLASLFIGHEMRCPECNTTSMSKGQCFKCADKVEGDVLPVTEPAEPVMVAADGYRMAFLQRTSTGLRNRVPECPAARWPSCSRQRTATRS